MSNIENDPDAGPQPWPQGEDYDPRQDPGPDRIEDKVNIDATPAAEELAADLGVDLRSVEPTGAGDRIIVSDVREAASNDTAEDQ